MNDARIGSSRSPWLLINGRFLSQSLSGVQRHALEITRALVARDCDVLVAAPHDARIPEEIAPFTHRLGRTRGHTWEQRDLASFAGMHRAPLWSPGNTGPIRVARQLVTLHDLFPYRFPDYHSRTFRIWYRTLHRALALRGVRFAAVSQYTRDEIVSLLGVAPERVAIVPGGVGPQFRPIERAVCERTSAATGIATAIHHDVGGGFPAEELGAPRARLASRSRDRPGHRTGIGRRDGLSACFGSCLARSRVARVAGRACP